eukprot:631912-Pelagomonas_calceolata.AAC.1
MNNINLCHSREELRLFWANVSLFPLLVRRASSAHVTFPFLPWQACSLDVPYGAAHDDLKSAVSNVVLGPEDERWTK